MRKCSLCYERLKPYDDCMKEECGVFGIYMNDDIYDPAEACYLGLYALQHRGQESAGIAVSYGNEMRLHKGMGLCSEVFRDNLDKLKGGRIGIGHVRYSTSGVSELLNSQPLVMSYMSGKLALAHNGNLINAAILREKLEQDGAIFQTTLDTEVIAYLLAKDAKEGEVESIKKMMSVVKGSYALVIATDDTLIGVRDPQGIRPLALGRLDQQLRSRFGSCAFDAIDAEFRTRRPSWRDNNNRRSRLLQVVSDEFRARQALCIFEYVYFARPDSDKTA